MEELEILIPPMFEPTGEKMTASDAFMSGKWVGSANVWVYRFNEEDGAIQFLYQEREPNSPWMPGKLDVAAGGYFKSGEARSIPSRLDGALRELKEELGLQPRPGRLRHITRRLNVGISQKGIERKSCCDIYAYEFGDSENVAMLQDEESGVLEVTAVYWIDLDDLLAMHADSATVISVQRYAHDRTVQYRDITAEDFCPNYDDYLFTMPVMIASLVKNK